MLFYAITDPSTLSFNALADDMARFAAKADVILYRDKYNPDYTANARYFINEAKKYPFDKVLLHNAVETAWVLNAHGVHLSSDRIEEAVEAKKKGLFVVVSTHSLEEAIIAQKYGADMIAFSPVFETPGKGKPAGLEKLAEIVLAVSIPVIALGGIITQAQIDACSEAGAKGFASIRYFK